MNSPDAITPLNAALEGRYRIASELGEGGMATVYLADDLKHERRVALKVLKPELAAVVGAQRFLAEIKTTANLQHPHILPLFDSGAADSFLFYVMPYVEGETLRDRLEREKQLPVDEAVRIATDVAEALHSAHEQGVIHRDIKPANILMSGGRPLVADFGIALAVSAAGGGRLTETGLSMGTPFYMSPEQASADREPSAASDVYSLGCVLYEMLVGEPPYIGSSAQAVLAKILTADAPAPTEARASIPANVDAVTRKALEKLPADRFTSAQDFARALGDPGFRHGESPKTVAVGGQGPWKWLSVGTLAVAVASTSVAGWALRRPEAAAPIEVFESPFRQDQRPLRRGTTQSVGELSADGTTLVYTGPGESPFGQLWVRYWREAEAEPIPGTENAGQAAISPDGRQLAYVQNGTLKVLSLEGGPPRTYSQAFAPRWGLDGEFYSQDRDRQVIRYSADGEVGEVVSERAPGEGPHRMTDALANGWGLVTVYSMADAAPEIRAIDLRTGETKPLLAGEDAKYAETGHLLYLTADATLMANRLDLRSMDLVGPSVPVYENVHPDFTLSKTGKLVYAAGPQASEGATAELVWMDRTGEATPLGVAFTPTGVFAFGWSLSPDGGRLAYDNKEGGNDDIWVRHLPVGPSERITVGGVSEMAPWWTPDGESITYLAEESGFLAVWSTEADGTGEPRLIHSEARSLNVGTWSPDGGWLVVGATRNRNSDIVALHPGVDSATISLIATEFQERLPTLSPDGRWLAYSSNRTGRNEIYVSPFPDVDSARVLVSIEGGMVPVWAHSGAELFYVDADLTLVSARVETVTEFRVTGREALFAIPQETVLNRSGLARFYDVSLDDQRFLLGQRIERGGEVPPARIFLVNNFFEELKRLVPN